MFAKKIKYTNFAGETREEEFFFHMSKTDIVQWQYSVNGGIDQLFKRIINKGDQHALIETVKDLIHRSYGEVSIDGKSFERKRDGRSLADDFEQTAAYDVLFMELITDDKAAAEFLNGLMPPDILSQLAKTSRLPDDAPSDTN